MKQALRFFLSSILITLAFSFCVRAQDDIQVMYALRNHPDKFEETEDPAVQISDGDAAQIAIFEARGYDLIFWDNNMIQSDPEEALFVADDADLVG